MGREGQSISRCLFMVGAVVLVGSSAAAAEGNLDTGEERQDVVPRGQARPLPRLKASLEQFSVGMPLGLTPLVLTGAHVEVYPFSGRWARGGVGIAGGVGHAKVSDTQASVIYGLMGVSAGVQYPARVTPFVEGHFAGGLFSATLDRPVVVAGVTVDRASGTTWLVIRGLDAGAEFYTFGRAYVSGSVGWTRSTWAGADTNAGSTSPGNLRLADITADSLMWKLGVGL